MQLLPSEIHTITRYIYNEKCLILEDDVRKTHPELDLINLKVRKVVNRLTGKGFLKKIFVWRHGWYSLTEEGNEYLRESLGISGSAGAQIVENSAIKNID